MNTVVTNALSALVGDAQSKSRLSKKDDNSFATTLSSISSHISKRQFDKAGNLIARLDEEDAIVKKLKEALEDAKLAQKLEEQRRSESEALKKMRTAVENAREAEKERARQKIEKIKQEIAMLMMMARINPKAVARRLAQLSKELAAAVKAYGGASTSSSALTGAAATGGGAAVASGGDAAGANAQAAASTADTASVSGANSIPTTSQSEEGKNNSSQDSAQGQKEQAQTEEKEKLKAELMGIAEKQAEQLSRTKEDREFMDEVRKVKGQLKALIELVKRQLELEEKGEDNDDIKSAEKSLRDVDTELSNLQSNVLTVQLSVNISV